MMAQSLRWIWPLVLLASAFAPTGCDRPPPPSDNPEAKVAAERAAATRGAPKSAIEIGDPLASYRRRAEAGDVSAMIFLGRSYEALGGAKNKQQARDWYQKAADVGDESAKQLIATMDAAATRPYEADPIPVATTPPPPTSAPVELAPGVVVVPGAAAGPATTQIGDLTKLTWKQVLGSFDTTDFVTLQRDDYRKSPADDPVFVGLSNAPDKTLTVAGYGRTGDDLREIVIMMRVRTRQNPSESRRVSQSASIVNTATRNNVMSNEFLAWVTEYLSTGMRLDPIYRNGWRIEITGPQADKRTDDKAFLGEAVVVKMKR
jgi:hypothetical protein